MAIYEVGKSRYELPDDLPPEKLQEVLTQLASYEQPETPHKSKAGDVKFEQVFNNLIQAESRGKHRDKDGNLTTSPVGAEGITQVMPATQQDPGYGITPMRDKSEAEFKRFGRDYLQKMLEEFNGDYELALAAYNAGPGNVKKAVAKGGDQWKNHLPKPQETLPYIEKILGGTHQQARTQQVRLPPEGQEVADMAGTFPDTGDAPLGFGEVPKSVRPKDLVSHMGWLDASFLMHQMWEGTEFDGTDEELAEWGLQFMADFEYNLVSLGRIGNKIHNVADPEQKEALAFMMDTFDNVKTSWAGTGRAAKAILTDPLTYVGISSLGIGIGGKAIAKESAKATFREYLKQGMGRTGVIAGIEGGLFTGAQDYMRQGIEVDVGKRDERSGLQTAASSAIGVAAGFGIGTLADAAASKLAASLRGKPKVSPKEKPEATPEGTEVAPAQSPQGAPGERPTIQKMVGRRPEDDTMTGPVGLDEADLRAAGFNLDEINTGLRTTPKTMAELNHFAKGLARQLRNMEQTEVEAVMEALRRNHLSNEENQNLSRSIQMAADSLKVERAKIIHDLHNPKITDQKKINELLDRKKEIEGIIVPIEMADEAFGSFAGSLLRQRREGLTDLRGISVETIMKNYPDMTVDQAEKLYADTVLRIGLEREARGIRKEFESKIDEAVKAGDATTAVRLLEDRERAVDDLMEASGLPPETRADIQSGLEKYGSQYKATTMEKINELAISNVFSTTTLMINLVPSAIKTVISPALKAIVSNPLERATRIEAAAHYSAMASVSKGAIKAAVMAFRYEQAILTRDTARLMEGELAMGGGRVSGKVAGLLRTIPRLLNATDEFLSHLAYNGFVSGKASAEAYIKAIERGLSKQEAMKVSKEAAKKALDDAYKQNDLEHRLRPIINKGMNLGYRGETLTKFVVAEAKKNLQWIKHGTNEEGLDYIRDLLYKRRFTGENLPSRMAQSLEGFMHRVPSVKFLLGQLFFRTPIRVFEEGIRLTPGLQFIAPNFISDLAGRNGMARQARAQGEALLSLAFAANTIMLYSEGRITGSSAYDSFRQDKLRNDSGLPDSYTIKLEDGSTWSYKNFDPIATPTKIIVNALEWMDKLNIREAQGEFVDNDRKKALAQINAAIMPVVGAISDANLVAGFTTTVKLVTGLTDVEDKSDQFVKYLGERLHLLVPNTFHKMAKTDAPYIKDPKTFEQVVEARLGSIGVDFSEVKTPYAYDVFGSRRSIKDVGQLWNIFSTASVEDRKRGHSEEYLRAIGELERLQRVTGVEFKTPYTHSMTGKLDMRTILTKDGKETMYDRWNEIYRSLQPELQVLPILLSPLPDGTFETKGLRVETLNATLNTLRDVAFKQLMAEQGEHLIDHFQKNTVKTIFDRTGQNDYRPSSRAAPAAPW